MIDVLLLRFALELVRRARRMFVMALTVSVVMGLVACGSAQKDPRAPRPRGFSSCAIADVSGSTLKARPLYLDAFRRFATTAAKQGSGVLCVVLAAGDPQAEGAPRTTSVAPEHPHNAAYGPGEVVRAVAMASAQFSQMLLHPPVHRSGSAILEAVASLAPELRRRDHLLIASDGIQASDLVDFHTADLSPAGTKALLGRLREAQLLPDLKGVRVEMPLLLAHPGGTHLTQRQEAQIRTFWKAWARAAGTQLATQFAGG